MVKCPSCKEGDLLLFLEKTKAPHSGQYSPGSEGDYEIVYKCMKCGEEVRKSDLPFLELFKKKF